MIVDIAVNNILEYYCIKAFVFLLGLLFDAPLDCSITHWKEVLNTHTRCLNKFAIKILCDIFYFCYSKDHILT